MRISSNRNSACRECKREWKAGEQIHYDPFSRATCIDQTCFENQVRSRTGKNEHNKPTSNTNENTVNSQNQFKLENEAEFRSKIQEKLAKYKIIMEESEKFLENHCKDNKSDAKTSVELILRELL